MALVFVFYFKYNGQYDERRLTEGLCEFDGFHVAEAAG